MSETGREVPEVPKPSSPKRRQLLRGLAGVAGIAAISSTMPEGVFAAEGQSAELANFIAKTEELSASTQCFLPLNSGKIRMRHFTGSDYLTYGVCDRVTDGRVTSSVDVYTPDNSKTSLDYAYFMTAEEVGKIVSQSNMDYPARTITKNYKKRTGGDLEEDFKRAIKFFDVSNFISLPADKSMLEKIKSTQPVIGEEIYSRAFAILRTNPAKALELLKGVPQDKIDEAKKAANILVTALELTFDNKSASVPLSSTGFNAKDINNIVKFSGKPTTLALVA